MIPRAATGRCTCGWQDAAVNRDEVRFHYRDHLVEVAPAALTLAELRRRATGMPHRRAAGRDEVVAWLTEHRPQALDAANYWR